MVQQIYEIWSEGYIATGEYGHAHMMAQEYGNTFLNACENLAAKDYHFANYFKVNNGIPYYWGCRLFPSRQEAQITYG